MYKVLAEKFELDVSYIIERERQWVGQAVVARDDRTGEYGLGILIRRDTLLMFFKLFEIRYVFLALYCLCISFV